MIQKPTADPDTHDSSGRATTEQLLEWFKSVTDYLPHLPFVKSDRNDNLRYEIVQRFIGHLLTDDERAAFYGLPIGCRIREGAKIISPSKLKIGEYCWIGENAVLDASGGLSIGSHTSIGLSVFVWSHSSHLTNLNMQNTVGSNLIKRAHTSIGSGCFIAGPAVILAGSKIGDKCLIRPFSVIEGEIPDRSLVSPTEIKSGILTDGMIKKMTKKLQE